MKRIADNIKICGGLDIHELCRNLSWCYSYKATTKSNYGDRPAVLDYDEEDYARFLESSKQHSLFQSV